MQGFGIMVHLLTPHESGVDGWFPYMLRAVHGDSVSLVSSIGRRSTTYDTIVFRDPDRTAAVHDDLLRMFGRYCSTGYRVEPKSAVVL